MSLNATVKTSLKASVIALFAIASGSALASDGPLVTTAIGAVQAKDGDDVMLQGRIVEQVGPEHYTFVDHRGLAITVEIEAEELEGLKFTSMDYMRLYGEVERKDGFTMVDDARIEHL